MVSGGSGQWFNLGATYVAVTFLRPQGQSLVLYTLRAPIASSSRHSTHPPRRRLQEAPRAHLRAASVGSRWLRHATARRRRGLYTWRTR